MLRIASSVEPNITNGIHIYADVFYFHECQSKFKNVPSLPPTQINSVTIYIFVFSVEDS